MSNMPKIKLKFGEVEADESIPSMDAIAQEIDGNGIFGYQGDRRGVSTRAEDPQYGVGEDYIFIRYVQEVSEERKQIEDGDITFGETDIARIMRFLLTRDGTYAYESTSGVYDDDALEYLIGEDSFGIDFTCDRYNTFTREQMRSFYDRAFRVRGLKIEEIARREPDEHSFNDDLVNHVENIGESAVRAVFSTGSQDNNLKGPEVIDGLARFSDLDYIRMKDSEGQIQEAYENGRYQFSHPADMNIPEQGERVRDIMESVIDGLEHEEEEED